MPRYFFSMEDHGQEPDDVGTDLPDRETARIEAIRYAGAVLYDDPQFLEAGRKLSVFVTDEARNRCFQIEIRAIDPD